MDHISHLEREVFKIYQCISLFHYYLPLEIRVALHLNKLESSLPKDALCQVWLRLTQWFWKRRFLHFVNVFSLFCYYLTSNKGMALHLNNLEKPSPKDVLYKVLTYSSLLNWICNFKIIFRGIFQWKILANRLALVGMACRRRPQLVLYWYVY